MFLRYQGFLNFLLLGGVERLGWGVETSERHGEKHKLKTQGSLGSMRLDFPEELCISSEGTVVIVINAVAAE